jgi:putative membrane protein
MTETQSARPPLAPAARIAIPSRSQELVPALLLAGYLAVFAWGAVAPYDRATWWVENVPIVGVVSALVILYVRGVRFTPLAYVLMAVLPYWHTVGGHYTFERVPFGWFSRAFGFERNMFDRVGHFSVGFFAFGIVELLVARRAMSRRLACLFALFAIAFVAMSYELIEWGYAAYGGNAEAGANFLGSQGDVWDAQKDMLMDTLGGIVAIALYVALRRGRSARDAHREEGAAVVRG